MCNRTNVENEEKREDFICLVIDSLQSTKDLPHWALQPWEAGRTKTAFSFCLQHLLFGGGVTPPGHTLSGPCDHESREKDQRKGMEGAKPEGGAMSSHTVAASSRGPCTLSWSPLPPSWSPHSLTGCPLLPGRHGRHRMLGPLGRCQDELLLCDCW